VPQLLPLVAAQRQFNVPFMRWWLHLNLHKAAWARQQGPPQQHPAAAGRNDVSLWLALPSIATALLPVVSNWHALPRTEARLRALTPSSAGGPAVP
jgi:hypothetical protein